MKNVITILLIFMPWVTYAQEELTLNKCYELVNANYPLNKQIEYMSQQNSIDVSVIKASKLPQLEFSAQATYQSDVIEFPFSFPGSRVEPPNNDQYKATVSANQILYGGGVIDKAINLKEAELKVKQKQVEVSLYQLKKQVNQLYFSILLLQEKQDLIKARSEQLESKLKEVKAAIKYGVVLPASDKIIEAELLQIEQQSIEITQNKTSFINTLSELIGKEISLNTELQSPIISSDNNSENMRPELELFQLEKSKIELSEKLIRNQNSPKLMGFGTGGYGNPGLNMLDNSFQPYYLVGLKLNWNIFDWNVSKNKRKSLLINKSIIDNQQEIFELNTTIELNQHQSEINKINEFIKSDNEIIELRKIILKTADAQLKNGVITSSAYIIELTNLFEAVNNLKTHEIQLLLTKANYNVTLGN
ncbi:MAG: TolC family protein [Bacteroidetes bacterium]|nr:MAG: TolC family protein [Bacteroidota bacterium]MBL1145057.1 TolC family protein [Bacteroidota bacterium]NOG57854.1 TolC family protein [Bacteroidota bacterium]